MELLVDSEIAGARAAFAAFGEVRLCQGRGLRATDLGAAEVLLVRSVTRVDRALLDGSRVRFVGTATSGTDHVDTAYLDAAGIAFAAAPGCNARAVAEHVMCCVYAHAAAAERAVEDLTLGIVGYGHVGRALGALAARLGMPLIVNDPPLGAALAGVAAGTLDEALECDVVSLHVPLSDTGPHATRNLVDAARLARLRAGALLINSARGGVVDEAALRERLGAGDGVRAAIDCWAGEPQVSMALSAAASYATPHIAGHTLEARVAACAQLHRALAHWTGRAAALPDLLAASPAPALTLGAGGVAGLLAHAHPLGAHTQRMRELAVLPGAARAARFDECRRRFGLRREFASHTVACAPADADTVRQLDALGFLTAAHA